MRVSAETVRCQSDLGMFERLLEDLTVKRVNEQIEQEAKKDGGRTGLRRRLLTTSVRLSEAMAPDLRRIADECSERLELGIELELYVYSSPVYNAMCFKPEANRLFVMFSSSLLEAFTDAELKFVMGHELGHHVYNHHEIPIGYILRGGTRPDPRLALDLFTWSRYAEISADRAGAHCAQDLLAVSRALFKLASGLSGSTVQFHLDDFLAQVDAMQIEDAVPGQGAPKEDWFSTHPFSPLRVKALSLFYDSELAGGTQSKADLEVAVQGVMSLMEPSYLDGRTDTAENMRRLLFAGALVVANADGNISEEEVAIFEKFFGKGAFSDSLNLDALQSDLDDRIVQVREMASTPQAMQVLRDLCLVARAEGRISQVETDVLNNIADGLGVAREFVCQSLDSELEPD
ncbi:MAG: M48 family metallopeptidase [Gammaproteobacteria bacterium]|nr:M48 family metallopeptidase [Gammaproteobacteria bacterium]